MAALEQYPVVHPDNPAITGPTISQLNAPATAAGIAGRGAVVVSSGTPVQAGKMPAAGLSGTLDRSPCGTGTCAKMAVAHARGELAVGETYANAGPLGTVFTGRIDSTTRVGDYDAIVPSLSGQAWIAGVSQYMLDPTDPFPAGFTVSDIWA